MIISVVYDETQEPIMSVTYAVTDTHSIHEIISLLVRSARVISSSVLVHEESVSTHSAETGACLCTSFRYDTRTNLCTDCGHVAHNSRVHCGGLK